jgi:hypothetical protein
VFSEDGGQSLLVLMTVRPLVSAVPSLAHTSMRCITEAAIGFLATRSPTLSPAPRPCPGVWSFGAPGRPIHPRPALACPVEAICLEAFGTVLVLWRPAGSFRGLGLAALWSSRVADGGAHALVEVVLADLVDQS